MPNFYAESERITSDTIVERLLEAVPRAEERDVAMAATSTSRDLRFLDPAVIARLGTMELKARTIVEGFLSGLHRSPFKGFSVEFAEYRQYLPGDDLSTIDWKVYARSDRHYVKKFEEETNLECHLLLDVSGSMALRGSRADDQDRVRRRCSRRRWRILMNRQRDAAGLIAFDDRIVVAAAGRARGPGICTRCCSRSSGCEPGERVRRRPAAASARRGAASSAAWSC